MNNTTETTELKKQLMAEMNTLKNECERIEIKIYAVMQEKGVRSGDHLHFESLIQQKVRQRKQLMDQYMAL